MPQLQPPTPDTIVAVSSPPGRSPRGLIRLSGPATNDALARILVNVPDTIRSLIPVRLRRPAIPALLARFTAPHSYTGEDAAELQLPGNAALLDRVLHQAIATKVERQGQTSGGGVRLAEPGEFTFRAYTAGKLDLTQAEGIAATISATSDSQLRAATLLREGKLGGVAASLVDTLGNALALVEAGIDFTDQEDVVPIAPGRLLQRIDGLLEALDTVLERSRSWGAIQAPPRVVLVGPPSAGKSTLFNALLGHERAIIDPTPGTTRDVLAEPLHLQTPTGPAEVMLIDLAGLDDALLPTPGNPAAAPGISPGISHVNPAAALPDRHAQQAARDAIRTADLILAIHERGSRNLFDAFATPPAGVPILHIQTKHDTTLASPCLCEVPPRDQPDAVIPVSAATGHNLDTLRTAITRALGDLAVSITGDMLALQPRHESALRLAHAQLAETRELLAPFAHASALPDIELLATTMRTALDTLAALGGRLTPDEVIGRVFATFCVGK